MALSGGTPPPTRAATAAAGCTAGTESDFNGDGIRDIAIADPEATVSGRAEAGVVHVVYGGGKGTAVISQGTAGAPGVPEAGDRYGHALAVFDHNGDGCSDLVVSSPYEDIEDQADAGSVQVLYGASNGLTTGPAALDLVQGKGGGNIGSAVPEGGDWFGYATAAGTTSAGEPYLVIGVPGEDAGSIADSGMIHYLRNSVNAGVTQDNDGVPGLVEANDRFGYAVAASPLHIAVGGPGEMIGDNTFSGAVWVFGHTLRDDGLPTPLAGIDQDSPGVNGGAETGDQMGVALATVQYRPSGASSTNETLIAVGVPGEDLATGEDAGRVINLRVTASGDVVQSADISQAYAAVVGVGEDGDYFGQHLTAVNTAPDSVGTARTVLLAVGIPGEDIEAAGAQDSGGVQIFPLIGPPGDGEVWLEQDLFGLPGTPGTREYLGTSLWATQQQLYVGKPYGPQADRGVYGIPWPNLVSDGTGTVTARRPGEGGLPSGDRAFGAVVR
ncbi:esterase [Streptomyces carminius]|uniref:Esterase n=2 Tax=Streptomyces carminius TaxID=2665496 RepID=A0A2M8M271_9ACTN|nr:esterase [Streptomyces carminius]